MSENNRSYESTGDAMPAVAPPKPIAPEKKLDDKLKDKNNESNKPAD